MGDNNAYMGKIGLSSSRSFEELFYLISRPELSETFLLYV